jgi:hypothetical protein
VSGGNAITINASPGDAINIIGVVLDGAALAGTNGIVFNSGGSLTVADSVVRNFAYSGTGNTTGNGILMQPASGAVSFVISNTIASKNGFVGIYYAPPNGGSAIANGVIDHVVATNNQGGIAIFTAGAGGSMTIAISNSVASNNSVEGIFIQDNGQGSNASPNVIASIDNTAISGNPNGISALATSKVLLGRSAITGNATGISISASLFFTYKDNRVNGNGTDVSGSQPTTDGLQ